MSVIQLAKGLDLPIKAVTETFSFLGKRGGGKTYGAGKLAEGMLHKKLVTTSSEGVKASDDLF